MSKIEKEEILDVLCSQYCELLSICDDYDVHLPMLGDYGYIRNYLNDNFEKVMECVGRCHCGKIVEAINLLAERN